MKGGLNRVKCRGSHFPGGWGMETRQPNLFTLEFWSLKSNQMTWSPFSRGPAPKQKNGKTNTYPIRQFMPPAQLKNLILCHPLHFPTQKNLHFLVLESRVPCKFRCLRKPDEWSTFCVTLTNSLIRERNFVQRVIFLVSIWSTALVLEHNHRFSQV